MYRSVSFWLDWQFLNWPNEQVKEKIIRRCDELANADVNMAIIFGTHFRWDYLPIISRVHDLLAFIAEQLHERSIELFDHHSSVLTHRVRSWKDREHIRRSNFHHLPFYPDPDFAAQMRYNGTLLNDWRMIDVETGEPIYIDTYRCEQFCMNNPDFRAAYQAYLRRLINDVPLDGLMSDDAIYYPRWRACGCKHCRGKFTEQFGHDLPPTTDAGFWFNRDNPAFQDWIDFRYRTAGDFMGVVRQAVGDMALMTCSSHSAGQACNATGMSYEEFANHASMSMLEICGTGMDEQGNWSQQILGRAMLQIAITRTYELDTCLALGYGFVPDSMKLMWQISRLLGSSTWLSTLKGRLVPKTDEIDSLPEEQNLLEGIYTWEKNHKELLCGDSDAKVCVFHSRFTRDHFTRSSDDLETVYNSTCIDLLEANVTFDAICTLDEISRYACCVIPSAACLSTAQRKTLREYINAGGVVIAIGPMGIRNEKGQQCDQFLREFGVTTEVVFPPLPQGYQPDEDVHTLPSIACKGKYHGADVDENSWVKLPVDKGALYWRPALKATKNHGASLVDILNNHHTEPVRVEAGLENWQIRRYRTGQAVTLVGMNSNIVPTFSKQFALAFGNKPIVTSLEYKNPCRELQLRVDSPVTSANLFTLDRPEPYVGNISSDGGVVSFACDEIKSFFVVELR